MPLNEYPSGTAFPGCDRADDRRVEPGVAATGPGGTGVPQRPVHRAGRHRFRSAGLLRQPDRTPRIWTRWRPAACATPTCTPRRCARRRARASSPGATTTRSGWPAITELATGYPGYNGIMPFENGLPVRDAAAAGLQHLLRRQVAPDARPSRRRRPGPTTAGRSGRGFERFYGFLGGDTNQWYPELIYDNHQVEPPKQPEEGYHLSVDLADKAIEFIADAKQVAPDKPFFLYFCPGRAHAPHHVAKEWADQYEGEFDEGWDAYRERCSPARRRWASSRPDAELSPARPGRARVGRRCRPTQRRLVRPA